MFFEPRCCPGGEAHVPGRARWGRIQIHAAARAKAAGRAQPRAYGKIPARNGEALSEGAAGIYVSGAQLMRGTLSCHAREGGHPVATDPSMRHGCATNIVLWLLDHPASADDDSRGCRTRRWPCLNVL